MQLDFVLPVPRSRSARRRAEAEGRPHTSAPDLANLCKAVEDALNGIAYGDDRQIWKLTATKRYGAGPGVQIDVRATETAHATKEAGRDG